jgi:membrane protease YdiL (CAAX protease family)
MNMNWVLGIGLPIIGAAFLLAIGNRVHSFVKYQLITLLGAAIFFSTALVLGDNKSIFTLGDLSAPANNLIDASYGAFALIALLVTTFVVYLQVLRGKKIDKALIFKSLLTALPLSAMNALTEELIFRGTLIQVLSGAATPLTLSLLSGLLFGIPHYFGNPGKIPGVIMAGFLGLIAAQSIFDTSGIGWAWAIHFVQDVPIITMLLLTGAKKL